MVAFLLLGGGAGLVTHRAVVKQREELVLRRASLSRLEDDIRLARDQLAAEQREFAQLERETAHALAAAAAREAAPAHLWASRVLLMRQLLEEMPAHRLPELHLLTLLDWIQVARNAELDTANRIRTAFIALRSLARRRFSEVLRPALRAFVAASGGELPADIRQLAPYLALPADVAILERYEMIRSGKAGAEDEYVIREKPGSDAVLYVALEAVSIDGNSAVQTPSPESFADAAERVSGLFDGIFDEKAAEKINDTLLPFIGILPVIVEKYSPQLTAAFGAEPDEVFKAATLRFRAANSDVNPTHLGQLLPHFPDPQKFLAIARQGFAELDYLLTHKTPAPDATALAPFLKKPFNAEAALRSVEIKTEDGHLSMNLKWTKSDTRTGLTPRPDHPASSP